jgi:hypothetical protein
LAEDPVAITRVITAGIQSDHRQHDSNHTRQRRPLAERPSLSATD